MDRVDCVIIGAGVIGLAIAREMALSGREVVVVEKESRFGSATSARNSEVIHAGIYYRHGSAKAKFCVSGKRLLYDYCRSHHIPHHRCGKLIVATSSAQVETLEQIRAGALANGVDDLRLITKSDAITMEPALRCEAALLSPSTGIIDSHALMNSLLGDAAACGATLALKSEVVSGQIESDGISLHVVSGGSDETSILARTVINAAGLFGPAVAANIRGFDCRHIPSYCFAKGNYYSLAGPAPFSHLVYPVPEPGGLGVHLTIDLGGQAKFGPDVEWLAISDAAEITYDVDPSRADKFYAEIRKYWPSLADGALYPAYSGVRPKASRPGAESDFAIQGPESHGADGLVNLFGIESPGLTASLSIAKEVSARLAQ